MLGLNSSPVFIQPMIFRTPLSALQQYAIISPIMCIKCSDHEFNSFEQLRPRHECVFFLIISIHFQETIGAQCSLGCRESLITAVYSTTCLIGKLFISISHILQLLGLLVK